MIFNYSYITGGWGRDGTYDYILKFNPKDGSWIQVGQLQVARAKHGASLVNVEDIFDYCQ